MKNTIYSTKGAEVGSVTLPENVFGVEYNADLVHQVVVAYQANARRSTAHTKTRSEVRGGGKKPWRQKGTGRARHGSSRSPIWIGGGVTFGPRNERIYTQKINRRQAAKALYVMLSKKLQDSQLLFIDTLIIPEAKTKYASDIMKALTAVKGFETLTTEKPTNALVLLPKITPEIAISFANLSFVRVDEVRNVNAYDLARFRYIIIASPEDAISFFAKKMMKHRRNTSQSNDVVAISENA